MQVPRLIVLSIDSLFDEDINFLKDLPNFGEILRHAAYVQGGMRSIYPSLTYPAHASLITGAYPERHGITNNEKTCETGLSREWYWYRQDVRSQTLLDAAHGAGLTTACLGWPCISADPAVDWLIPEIWPLPGENLEEVLRRSASPSVLGCGNILERRLPTYAKLGRVFVDQAITGYACDIIQNCRPDLLMIHLAYLDHTRHGNGLHASAVEAALIAHDGWLGQILLAVKDAGIAKETNIAIISDHGHLPVRQYFNPNILLVQSGLIQLDENGSPSSWDAICLPSGLSCQVVLHKSAGQAARNKLCDLLRDMRCTEEYGVESIFTKDELEREYHLSGEFDYMLEGCRATAFGGKFTGRVIEAAEDDPRKFFPKAGHGHLPHKGPQPIFFMAGPSVREGAVTERKRIVDEAPTFAKILGVEMPWSQGKSMDMLLYENERG